MKSFYVGILMAMSFFAGGWTTIVLLDRTGPRAEAQQVLPVISPAVAMSGVKCFTYGDNALSCVKEW
jgi:hypothetical protein